MLKENIKQLRKSKGLSQEELAIKLNVVRQTISKWEQGLSVPDSEMLVTISEVLETPVSTLLGENISEYKVDDLKAISEKLEIINLQLLQRANARRKIIHWIHFPSSVRQSIGAKSPSVAFRISPILYSFGFLTSLYPPAFPLAVSK